MEYKIFCENCKKEFVVSKSVYYRRLKEQRIFCRKCHTNLIGKHSEAVKIGKEKAKKTLLAHYGVDNPAKSQEIREKTRKNNLEKYGVEWVTQREDIKEKVRATTFEHYGVTCNLASPEQKEQVKQKLLKEYGVDNVAKIPEIKEKMLMTRFETQGSFLQDYKYYYDGVVFDSSWEVAFYIYYTEKGKKVERCRKYFEYSNNKKYFPDFEMDGQLYEIKGEQFFKNDVFIDPYHHDDVGAQEKWNFMKSLNVNILRKKDCLEFISYVENKYGKDFLKTLRKRNNDKDNKGGCLD